MDHGNQYVVKHTSIFSNGALALIAWISILIHKPFTIQYAKERFSKDKWEHPLFLRINYLLTTVWGLIFSISIVWHILRLYYPAFSVLGYEMISYTPSVFGIWFTIWFPSWYKKKYLESIHMKNIISASTQIQNYSRHIDVYKPII